MTESLTVVKLSALLVSALAMIPIQALAFEGFIEPMAQVYFIIPFGTFTMQEVAPRLGVRVNYSAKTQLDRTNPMLINSLVDWRVNLDGQFSLRLNGLDVDELLQRIGAGQDDETKGWILAAGVAAGTGLVTFHFVAVGDAER